MESLENIGEQGSHTNKTVIERRKSGLLFSWETKEVSERSGLCDAPGEGECCQGGEEEDQGECSEVWNPGGPSSQGHEDLLVSEVERHRQLAQHRDPAVGLGDQLSAGLR